MVSIGESLGNLDMSAYTTVPDYKIPLTPLGLHHARAAGFRIRSIILSDDEHRPDWKAHFYVSPYERTRSVLRELGPAFS